MTQTSANTNDIWSADDDRVTFASRFLKATGEYALAMFGAMFLAFLWMAKDVMLAPIASGTVEVIAEIIILWFVARQVWGYEYNRLARLLQAIVFSGPHLVRKSAIEANEEARGSQTPTTVTNTAGGKPVNMTLDKT